MPLFGWIRDLFGIQKDMYETKKTRLEIEKIEDEKRDKLITPASLEDVKKYDPKTRNLLEKIESFEGRLINLIVLLLIAYQFVKLLIQLTLR
jgi:hypothetical protein